MSNGRYWHRTANPITGCNPRFDCWQRCWARAMVTRFPHLDGRHGFAPGILHPDRLADILRWQPWRWRLPDPRQRPRVALNWLGDMFHTSVSDEAIDAVFGALSYQADCDFLVLTKDPVRARLWFARHANRGPSYWDSPVTACRDALRDMLRRHDIRTCRRGHEVHQWPLPNVWLGTSISTQADAEERLTPLLDCPAALRWVSAEPLLEHIDLNRWLPHAFRPGPAALGWADQCDALAPNGKSCCGYHRAEHPRPSLDWVVIGDETGPSSRLPHGCAPVSILEAAERTGTPVWLKHWTTLTNHIWTRWPPRDLPAASGVAPVERPHGWWRAAWWPWCQTHGRPLVHCGPHLDDCRVCGCAFPSGHPDPCAGARRPTSAERTACTYEFER